MLQDFSCGVVPVRVVDGVRQFLLVQHQAGHWAFPKGHPEAGESPIQAARRELAEETGIDDVALDEGHPLEETYQFTKRSGKQVSKRVVYYVGEVQPGQAVVVQAEEVAAYAWGDADETRQRITFEEGKRLFDAVAAYLEE